MLPRQTHFLIYLSSRQLLKKTFLFCYPHTLTIRLKRPVYRGFSGEGKCEGKLSPLTLALTPKSVLNPLVLARHQYLTLDKASAAHLQDSSDSSD